MGLTKPITVNGTVNLLTIMRAAGWTGGPVVSNLRIYNASASVLAYVHLTEGGVTGPSTGTDGWPIGGAAGAAGSTFEASRNGDMATLDMATTWIHTPSSIVLKFLAVGS